MVMTEIYLCFLMLTSEIQNETVVNVQEAEQGERVVWDLLVLGESDEVAGKKKFFPKRFC